MMALSAWQQPQQATQKDGAHLRSLRATPRQLNYFIALVFQQRRQHSALGKGRVANRPNQSMSQQPYCEST